jgi:hypothetical protein
MKEHLKSFREYYSLSAKLIDGMSKDDLAECARLMASISGAGSRRSVTVESERSGFGGVI